MRNAQLFIGAIVLGVLALIVGVLYLPSLNVLGDHPTRSVAAFIIGAILIIIGLVGMMLMRSRSRV